MSLASIKKKETKGKKRVLPKLVSVLDDPSKKHWPLLKDDELTEFTEIIEQSILESKVTPTEYVKKNSIRLGLESSLRIINQRQAACVFISLSLKPHFLIGLVARNVETKDATVPVYVQPKLENYTNRLFGIRTLILVIPKKTSLNVITELDKWVAARTRQPASSPPLLVTKATELKRKTPKNSKNRIVEVTAMSPPQQSTIPVAPKQEKKWTGDFISCGNDDHVVEPKKISKKAEQLLADTLNSLAEMAKEKTVDSQMEVDLEPIEVKSKIQQKIKEEDSECDDFLEGEYKQISVSHVAPNPNKNKKKKKNKNR